MADPLADALDVIRRHANVCSRAGEYDRLLAEADRIEARASGEGTAPQPDDGWIEVTPDALARACDRAHASPNAAEVGHREGFCLACAELRVAMSGERGTAPQVPAEVLWEGETHDHGAVNPNVSSIMDQYGADPVLPVPPGTRVRVVAADGAPVNVSAPVAADGAPQEGDERADT